MAVEPRNMDMPPELTPEQKAELNRIAETQFALERAAEDDSAIRDVIREQINSGLDLPKVQKDKCSGCKEPGIWIESAPKPLMCPNCYELETAIQELEKQVST